jgi:uncharacterized protein YceK
MRFLRLTGLLLLPCFALGCASIGARQRDGAGRPFAGVRDDAHYLAHPSDADKPSLQFLNILDMPFSAVLDTLLLPHDLYVAE